jgi:hypothetical protein
MRLRPFLAAAAIALLVSGCGSGPAKRVTPSQVSIQQLVADPSGTWKLTLRIQNFSTVTMRYASLHGTLKIAGVDVGSIDLSPPDLDIPPNSADVIDTTLHASAKLPAGDIDYRISGTIQTSEPKTDFRFDRSSRLSPAPGLPGTWR